MHCTYYHHLAILNYFKETGVERGLFQLYITLDFSGQYWDYSIASPSPVAINTETYENPL